jgi:hypothetical protein
MSAIPHKLRCADSIGLMTENMRVKRVAWLRRSEYTSPNGAFTCYKCEKDVNVGQAYYIKDGNKHRKLRHLECAAQVNMIDPQDLPRLQEYLRSNPNVVLKVAQANENQIYLVAKTGVTV